MTFLNWIFILLLLAAAGSVGFTAFIAWQAERALPPAGHFVDINGEKIHYLDVGSGPALLMIHGLTGNTGHFSYALINLLSHDFRVIVVDRPGSGYSTRADDAPSDLLAQARALAKFIKALKLDLPLVIGHSLGGGVALALAEQAPESVGGLALIAPFTHSVAEPPEPFLGLAIVSSLKRKIVAWTIATPLSMFNAKKTLAAVFSPERAPDDFNIRGGGLLTLRPSNFYAASADMVTSNNDLPEMIQAYPSLTMPIGVLYARDDAILDYRAHGEALKYERPTTELVLLASGGHMLPITAPELCARFIRDIAKKTLAPAAN